MTNSTLVPRSEEPSVKVLAMWFEKTIDAKVAMVLLSVWEQPWMMTL
jgi:hypothetical protein